MTVVEKKAPRNPIVHHTAGGTPYLQEPGVALIAQPAFHPMQVNSFVNSFDDVFDAADYENDFYAARSSAQGPDELNQEDGTLLMKFAGQLCYLSFGENRTKNDDAGVKKYFDNIRSSGHGSVLEHANYSFLVWGIDRACSHEVVRHRAGFAYSQLSQRFVDGKTLRFVERQEYQDDPTLHSQFCEWIETCERTYNWRAEQLRRVINTEGMSKTDARKKVNSAARNCLPNETETAMVVTANVRAWRHFTEMRASQHADSPIRTLAMRIYQVLFETAPALFDDYERGTAGPDGIKTSWRKA